MIVVPIVNALALFPAVYCTFNLAHHELLSTDFWRHELASGVFALRVSSYLLTFHFFAGLRRYVQRKHELTTQRVARGLTGAQATTFGIDLQPAESLMWKRGDLAGVATFQFGFYLSVLTALWLCAIQGVSVLTTSLASWCLFFIADDWVIIAQYTTRLNVPALLQHTIKILAFDIALLLLVSGTILAHLRGPVGMGVIVAMLVCALAVGVLTSRAHRLHANSDA